MALNPYISSRVKSERDLYENMVIEAIKMYGINVKYLPRKTIEEDKLLNEDIVSRFDSAYTVEVYVETVDGFEGDGRLFSKFGLEIRDQATVVVAKRRWDKEVGMFVDSNNPVRPSEGDLIFIPMSKSMFEVRFVEHESPFYQLQNVPCYRLQIELFEYRNEAIRTGDDFADANERENAFTVSLEIDPMMGEFVAGMDIIQTGTNGIVTGHVMRSEIRLGKKLIHVGSIGSLDKKVRSFSAGSLITSKDGIVSGTVTKVYNLSDPVDFTTVNEPLEQNHTLEQIKNDVIDFSEDNPFGDIRPPSRD